MITRPFVKINLGLNVLRKRTDGFHDIETLFVPYHDITDVLEIIKADDYSATIGHLESSYSVAEGQLVQAISEDAKVMITIARSEGVGWDPLNDLTVKAYRLLDKDYGLSPVKIFLEKLSPVGAGLGGGSSDATFALIMLNDIFALGLSVRQIAQYASYLGSDCAFFAYDTPMFGEGRGELLSLFDLPESFDDEYDIKVVVPEDVSVSTADAYGGIIPSVPKNSLKDVLKLPVGQWKDTLFNDFETTVFGKYPGLKNIKQSLYDAGAVYASMSGSGSAFFAIFRKSI